jgi:hypothetical protein
MDMFKTEDNLGLLTTGLVNTSAEVFLQLDHNATTLNSTMNSQVLDSCGRIQLLTFSNDYHDSIWLIIQIKYT